jgi:hypothetical protein
LKKVEVRLSSMFQVGGKGVMSKVLHNKQGNFIVERELSGKFYVESRYESGIWDSDPRHLPWEGNALPTELIPH